MKFSLRKKLTIIFLVLISVPLISLGIFSYLKSSTAMQTSSEEALQTATKLTAKNIQNLEESAKVAVQLISSSKALEDSLVSQNDQTLQNGYNYLDEVQKKHSNLFETLLVVDPTGKVIYTNGSQSPDLNISEREYFKTAISGQPTQSDVLQSKATGSLVIAMAYPLKSGANVIGVVVGTVKFEVIAKELASIKIGNGGYAYLLDKQGVFLYHPKAEKIFKENLFDTAKGNKQLQALTEIMKTGKAGSGEYTYEGVRKYVAFDAVGSWTLATTSNYKDYMSAALSIRTYTIITIIICLIVAMLIAFFLTTMNIVRPIKSLESLMAKAGDGDLTVESNIKTKDELEELGTAFNKMIENQKHIIGNVRTGAEDLSATSEEMAASSEEITANAEQVTNSILEVSADTDKQKSTIVEISEVLVQLSSLINIAQSRALTTKTNSKASMDVAQDGRKKVEDNVIAIRNISTTSQEMEVILNVLDGLSKKVSGIIEMINSISDQTNLLALNAAIEAARAGEHGKGFSVVADEVRKLSEQSAVGANEISQLVNEMVKQIGLAVKSMEQSKQSVENGVNVVKQTDEAFLSIINSVNQIAKEIDQIVEVTKDEVANSDEIVKLIDSIATFSEFNANNCSDVASASEQQTSAVQNLSAAAEETSSLAFELNKMVEKFII